MREFKFRIWDKDKKKFLTNTDYKDFVINMQGQVYIINGFFDDAKVDEYSGIVVQLYTGLKDCKGREIYEGDIIEFALSLFESVKGSVEFDYGAFYLKTDNKKYGNVLLANMNFDLVEVIGNIYENKELLK